MRKEEYQRRIYQKSVALYNKLEKQKEKKNSIIIMT